MYTNLNNVGPGVLFSFQMNMNVHSHLKAKIVGCILPSVEQYPGNALFTIRAQKYGMTSCMIWRPSVWACLKEALKIIYSLNQ